MPFIALTERAFTRLVNEQYALLQRSIAAQERLQRIVLSERGLDAIVGALSTLVGGAALVFDGRGELEEQRTFRRELDPEAVAALGAELHDRARRGDGRGFVPGHPELAPRALVLPVGGSEAPGGGLPQAWLVAVKDTGGLAEIDRLILHQAVTVIALELLRRRVADSTERRLAGDVLTAMVGGQLEGAELQRRLEPFGLGGRVSALVLAAGREQARPAVEAAVPRRCAPRPSPASSPRTGRNVCALLPGYAEDELFELAGRVVARAGEALGTRAGGLRPAPGGPCRPAGPARPTTRPAARSRPAP